MSEAPRKVDSAGVLYVTLTLLGWSSVLLFLKYLAPFIDAWTANGWRYGVSALIWAPMLAYLSSRSRLPVGLFRRALVPAFFNCIGQICFGLAPYYIGPGLAGFLLRVSIVFSTFGAFVLFADERVLVKNALFWNGMILIVVGSVGTVFLGQTEIVGVTAVGVLLGAGAGAAFGLYGVAVRYWMHGVPSAVSFGAISQVTALGMIVMMLWRGREHGLAALELSAFNWFILVVSSLIGIALGHVFYYAAMARLGVAVASAIAQLAPFLGGVGAVFIFNEVLTGPQWVSGGIMLLGSLLLLRAEQWRAERNLKAPALQPDANRKPGLVA